MIKGVLFDMDGVLVNNTEAHIEAFAVFCERYEVRGWQEKIATAYGMGNEDIMRIILPSELIEQRGIRELGAEKEAIYRELYAPRMIPVAGLAELLEKLRTSGIRLAVGSSGPIENVRMVIEGCGVAPYFDFIVSGDRVSRCKPDPEIYLTAAAGLGLQTAECLIFEDALAGIESARRAGAGRIVALATTCTRETLLKEPNLAYVIEDYTQITDLNDLLN